MKIKYLYFIIIVFSIFLGISILTAKEKPLIIITSPKVYSMKHTELNETFGISVLMNRNDTYHLNPSYIRSSSIIDGDNQLPINIEKIELLNDQIEVENESFYVVKFLVNLQLESNDHFIQYENATMEITYQNDKTIDLYIGELNYLFKENSNDLSLYNMHGTFGEVSSINTVTGVSLELMNRSSDNIIIKRIDIASKDVSFNNGYLIEQHREIDMFESVNDVLLVESYDFSGFESGESQHPIFEGQMKQFYIPLIYRDEIKYISRFSLIVTYEIDGIDKEYYIDDFIFMNRTNFGPEFEQYYQVYVYED